MKITVKDYLNVRIGKPSLNAPSYQYLAPGSILEVDGNLYKGDVFEGSNNWLKDEAGNYYWSGGVQFAHDFPGHEESWYLSDFGIPKLWDITMGEDVEVILLDSGVSVKNTSQPGRLAEYNVLDADTTDTCGHGTAMFSIIKGYKGFLGIAPLVSLQSIKLTKELGFNSSNLIKALQYLKKIIQIDKQYVVNCSFAIENCPEDSKQTIQEQILEINKGNNIVFCSAVGNFFANSKTVPAGLNSVISVAGIKKENDNYKRLISNNYWDSISLVCPGKFDMSALETQFTDLPSEGSSHACAYATGLIALICSLRLRKGKKTGYDEISDILKEITLDTLDKNNFQYPMLNKKKLLTKINNL